MNYYFLSHSTEQEIGKVFPQSQHSSLPTGKTVNDIDYVWNVLFCQLPAFKPFFGTVELHSKSKTTDLISSSTNSSGFIMSEKMSELISAFVLGEFVNYSISVRKPNNQISGYNWWHFANDLSPLIDFDKSSFYILSSLREKENVEIMSFQDLRRIRSEINIMSKIRPFEIVFQKESPLDCFYLQNIFWELIISERMYKSLLSKGITGCAFTKLEITILPNKV